MIRLEIVDAAVPALPALESAFSHTPCHFFRFRRLAASACFRLALAFLPFSRERAGSGAEGLRISLGSLLCNPIRIVPAVG